MFACERLCGAVYCLCAFIIECVRVCSVVIYGLMLYGFVFCVVVVFCVLCNCVSAFDHDLLCVVVCVFVRVVLLLFERAIVDGFVCFVCDLLCAISWFGFCVFLFVLVCVFVFNCVCCVQCVVWCCMVCRFPCVRVCVHVC